MSATIRRVLLVDDDAVVQMIGGALLKRGGYDVEIARDGAEALTCIAHAAPFDLIISDLNMPNVDGRALIVALRSQTTTARIPVVILTGADDADIGVSFADAGIVGALTKPINARTFLDQLHALLTGGM